MNDATEVAALAVIDSIEALMSVAVDDEAVETPALETIATFAAWLRNGGEASTAAEPAQAYRRVEIIGDVALRRLR